MGRHFHWRNASICPARTYMYFVVWVILCGLHATHSSAFVTLRAPNRHSVTKSLAESFNAATSTRSSSKWPAIRMSWLGPKRKPSLGGEWFNRAATSKPQEKEISCWIGEANFGRCDCSRKTCSGTGTVYVAEQLDRRLTNKPSQVRGSYQGRSQQRQASWRVKQPGLHVCFRDQR